MACIRCPNTLYSGIKRSLKDALSQSVLYRTVSQCVIICLAACPDMPCNSTFKEIEKLSVCVMYSAQAERAMAK